MATDYKKWDKWSTQYDSDGSDVEMNLSIPLDDVSDNHLKTIEKNPSKHNITAECGKPMTETEFKAYMKNRQPNPGPGTAPPVVSISE